MSTTTKLWMGFGLLFLLLVAIGLFVSRRLTLIERALTVITAVREPATAVTYEMEVNLLGTASAIRDYASGGDTSARERADAGFAEFDRFLIQYNRMAQSPISRALGRRIGTTYQRFHSSGDTLMDLSDAQRGRFRAFARACDGIAQVLGRELQPAIGDRGRDADRRARETASMSAAVAAIEAGAGRYTRTRDARERGRLDALEGDFRSALARYRQLHLSAFESGSIPPLERRFTEFVAQARELEEADEILRRFQARFLDEIRRLESLLDEGIQSLARTDLVLAQHSAERAIRTSLFAVLLLLAAGITIGSATAIPAGRSIVRTEQRLREQREELATAHRRKDEFLVVLSHELHNPLAPLSNALHVLETRGANLPEDVRRTHAMMQRQVQHITRLVDDLLDVSRINEGKIVLRCEPVNVGVLLEQTVEGLQRTIAARGHALRVASYGAPVWVNADPVRLGQIIANLVGNAVRYTPDGGRIEISLSREADEAVLRVHDDGVGIPPAMLSRVFEPFVQVDSSHTRQQGGLGIGLTLVQRLVAMHGGQVGAESPGSGLGSTFTVRLPAMAPPPEGHAAATAAPAPSDAVPRRILVVDDSEDSARTMAELLRLWGHDVQVAFDGLTALRAVAEGQPEIVLLDIALPGMDGYEVAEALRRRPDGGKLRLVALTGFGQAEDRRRAHEAGFDEHITKPAGPDVLREVIARIAAPRT